MQTSSKRIILLALVAVLVAGLGACARGSAPESSQGSVTIKIAILPILDALPMYVAQEEGLFEKNGVKVEFIPVSSAAERDQVIIAGQADGMINEIVSTLLYNKDQVQVQIVRFARVGTSSSPQYYILASGKGNISTVQDLKGIDIGISEGTIIEYMTVRLLQSQGLSQDDIQTIAVPKIDLRMNLLATGELEAAMLPDPFSFLAVQQGATVVLDDSSLPGFGHSTYAFRKAVIENNPQAISGFLAAIEEATTWINTDPSKWESLLSEQKLVPASLIGSYKISPYPAASVPGELLWDDVLAWALEKGLVSGSVSYTDSVNPSFLP